MKASRRFVDLTEDRQAQSSLNLGRGGGCKKFITNAIGKHDGSSRKRQPQALCNVFAAAVSFQGSDQLMSRKIPNNRFLTCAVSDFRGLTQILICGTFHHNFYNIPLNTSVTWKSRGVSRGATIILIEIWCTYQDMIQHRRFVGHC